MMNADQIRSSRPALGALLERFRSCFAKVNSFDHLQNYVGGLMTDVPRKSIEPIALACHTPVRTAILLQSTVLRRPNKKAETPKWLSLLALRD